MPSTLGIKFDYVFYGDLKTAPTRVELITTNYKEMQCKRLRMITRRVYQIQNMTYAMFDKSYVMKPTLILQSTFITYSKPIVVDTVTCKNGYKHLVEFDIKWVIHLSFPLVTISVPTRIRRLITTRC